MLVHFGDCTLDVEQRELTRGNRRVVVEPLVLDLLDFLIRNRERVVSRDEIIEHVWRDRIVSDATINSRMTTARQAIGDSGQKQTIIRTYSRRGYRFVGEAWGDEERTASSARPRDAGEIGTGALHARRRPVISVLAFATSSSDLDAFTKGIVEDITTGLSRLGWFSVLALSLSLLAGGWAADIRALGPDLGVDYAIEGSVRRVDGSTRITVRLISVEKGTAIWSSGYDVPSSKRETAADETTGTIVSTIAARVELAEISGARRKATVRDEGLRQYLLGMDQIYLWNRNGLENALQLFQMASEIDPEFAPAYGMTAYCYVQRKSNGWTSDRQQDEKDCSRLALRAAELAREDPLVLSRAAHAIASVSRDCETGQALIERALQIAPNFGTALYVSGWIKLFLGRPSDAAVDLASAVKIGSTNPMAFKVQAALSYAYMFLGRYDEGATIAERVCRIRPAYQTGLRAAAANHAMAGRSARARALLTSSLSLDPQQRLAVLPTLIPFRADAQMERWMTALRRAGMPS